MKSLALHSIWLIALFGVVPAARSQEQLQFLENKGQWHESVRFKGDLSAGMFLLTNDGYKVILHHPEDLERFGEATHGKLESTADQSSSGLLRPMTPEMPSVLRSHQYQMKFLNANPQSIIVPEKMIDTHTNFFIGNDPSRWASGCKTYLAITYKNIYPNIDIRYYTSNGTFKYDFIIHPGGRVQDIAMYFDGASSLRVKDGGLVVKTSVQEVRELPPVTYQLTTKEKIDIPCRFDLKGNILRFKLDTTIDPAATIVIDPSLVFSTFTGSRADNWGYSATYDAQGNFYAGGVVFGGNTGLTYPVSNGAFQTNFQGGGSTGEGGPFDMAIMKFNSSGTDRIYATYLGGAQGNEQPHSMVVDKDGNLVIAGRSTSNDYPTQGALRTYGSPASSLWHIVVSKLNASGTALIGSVRIGGSGNDGVNIRHKYTAPTGSESISRNYGDDARSEVILDNAGNVLFATCTQSPNFPTTPVSSQTTLGGTNSRGRAQDAVILKLTPNLGAVLFSVIFGGNDDDAAFVLSINPTNNNILVAGATASSNFPGNKSGVKFPAYQGGSGDGFLAEFSQNGNFVRSTYWGTSGVDGIYGVQFDKFGFPYMAGITTGNWPIENANFSQAGGKQFIVKLRPDLSSAVYSTVFGPNTPDPNLSPTAFLVDRCENVYYSGWGGGINTGFGFPGAGTNGLPVTTDGFQRTTDNSDFYFFVLEKNAASQLYGSYFGQVGGLGEHVDGGTSRFDENGVIYQSLCANCGNVKPRFPTTPGVWAPNNGSTGCNLAAVKIAFNLAGIGATIRTSIDGVLRDTTGCVPMRVDFTDTIAMGKRYIWDFNDGSPPLVTTSPSASHTFNTSGFFRVKLIAIDSSSCNISDSAFINLRVRNDKADLSFNQVKLPPCTSLTFQFSNTSAALKPFKSNSFRWDMGDGTTYTTGVSTFNHTYAAPGTYQVKMVLVDTNFCNEPDSVVKQIRLASNVVARFNTPLTGCVPYLAQLENTSLGGQTFIWNFGDGSPFSNEVNPSHLYSSTGNYQITLTAIDAASCNISSTTSFNIRVNPIPQAGIDFNPKPVPDNEPVNFINLSNNAVRYLWLFGDGASLQTFRKDTTVRYVFNATNTYNACIVAYNAEGCPDTACIDVPVKIVPGADLPNAFSPNGDGKNDRIFIRGYGIAKISWRIYSRWGELVYFSNDYLQGWDGTFKGKLLPQDVYHYVIDLEFSDGNKTVKKGDITLLR